MFCSKRTLVETAVELGYGTATALDSQFGNFRKCGLLDTFDHKEARQGGEGLWHPAQRELWLAYLKQRKLGVSQQTLANLPVGGWMFGMPGIPTRHAQAAFSYWLQPALKTRSTSDPRSRVGRGIRTALDDGAAPGSTSATKRRMRGMLEQLNAKPWAEGVSGDVLHDAATDLLSPDRASGSRAATHDELWFASGFERGATFSARGLQNASLLAINTPDVHAFWDWSRCVFQGTLHAYSDALPELEASPTTGWLNKEPSVQDIFENACSRLLPILGGGIDILISGRSIDPYGAPPPLPKRPKQA